MTTEKPVTGNDLTNLQDELGLKNVQLANYWGIDRNSIMKYKLLGDQPLPRNKMMRILMNDLRATFAK